MFPINQRISRRALLLAPLAAALALPGCDSPPEQVPPGMIRIPGGTFRMGADQSPYRFEGPEHTVTVSPFYLDRHEVTNAQWSEFVAATRFVTDAEKWGWSGVFSNQQKKWVRVDGADWRHPTGPKSNLRGKENYPVVQVSWDDVQAYCKWAGKRLPTEAEWEFAARGGLEGKKYPWGDSFQPQGKPMANYWQGTFPEKDLGADGFAGLAPVGKFPPNGYDLLDMAGNAWEWVADPFEEDYYSRSVARDPIGPIMDPAIPRGEARYTIRGGSFLCAENFCQGYRAAARNQNTAESATNHMGFRCARSINR